LTFIDGRIVSGESIDLLSITSYMRSIATNAAAAPTAAKAPPFWLCAMGAAAEIVPELLLAAVAEVVVPDPKLVAVLVLLGEGVFATVAEEGLEAPEMLEEPEEQTTEEGTVTPAEPQSC
jgi:hypothetical protein